VEPLKGDTGIMVLEQIQKEKEYLDNYAIGGRVGLKNGTDYWAMVTEMYIKSGGQEATGMDIQKVCRQVFQ